MPLAINTRTLTYTAPDGTTLHSYLALPADTNQQVAAVVITPEWWGLTEYPMRRADALAELGYAASVFYTPLRAHETSLHLVCCLLLVT